MHIALKPLCRKLIAESKVGKIGNAQVEISNFFIFAPAIYALSAKDLNAKCAKWRVILRFLYRFLHIGSGGKVVGINISHRCEARMFARALIAINIEQIIKVNEAIIFAVFVIKM